MQTVDSLIRLSGLLSPLAVRLLQIPGYARSQPERPAHGVIEPLMLVVLAQRLGHAPATMTVGTFWTEVARLGGYLARSQDGPPGWRTRGFGWLSLQTLLEGFICLFTSVYKMWVRIRLSTQGSLRKPIVPFIDLPYWVNLYWLVKPHICLQLSYIRG
jgi:hypothetical protein